LNCNPAETCGDPLPAEAGTNYNTAWNNQVNCNAACAGSGSSKSGGTCSGNTQFPPPSPHASGFGKSIWDWSVVDRVVIPPDLEEGEYLLSMRWDCEQSDQVFQNCADIEIKIGGPSPMSLLNTSKKLSQYRVSRRKDDVCDGLYESIEKCEKGKQKPNGQGLKCYALNKTNCISDPKCAWQDKGICWSKEETTTKKPYYNDAQGMLCLKLNKTGCSLDPKCEWLAKGACWSKAKETTTTMTKKTNDEQGWKCYEFKSKTECSSDPKCEMTAKGNCWSKSKVTTTPEPEPEPEKKKTNTKMTQSGSSTPAAPGMNGTTPLPTSQSSQVLINVIITLFLSVMTKV
jgi:hypothetical protein